MGDDDWVPKPENATGHFVWTDNVHVWFVNGHLHREDGPAVIFPNGHKEWFVNGSRTREEDPSGRVHIYSNTT